MKSQSEQSHVVPERLPSEQLLALKQRNLGETFLAKKVMSPSVYNQARKGKNQSG
jgi:hypothetical protein